MVIPYFITLYLITYKNQPELGPPPGPQKSLLSLLDAFTVYTLQLKTIANGKY